MYNPHILISYKKSTPLVAGTFQILRKFLRNLSERVGWEFPIPLGNPCARLALLYARLGIVDR